MRCLGFKFQTENGHLPPQSKWGSYLLVFMRTLHPMSFQHCYSLVDSRPRIDRFSTQPQNISCSLVGPYGDGLYVLSGIKYYSNTAQKEVTMENDDPNRSSLLTHLKQIFRADLLVLEGEFMEDFSLVEIYNH